MPLCYFRIIYMLEIHTKLILLDAGNMLLVLPAGSRGRGSCSVFFWLEAGLMLADQATTDAAPSGLGECLLIAARLANKLSALEAFSGHGVTISEWLLLSAFPVDGTPVTVKRLAVLTGLTPPRVKVLLVNLQSGGLVKGALTPEGRTTQPYSLSQTGLSKERSVRAIVSRLEQSLVSSAQVQAVRRANRILNRLSKGFVEGTLQKSPEPNGHPAVISSAPQAPRSTKRTTSRR